MGDFSKLKPGTDLIAEDDETHQLVVHRSDAGWTETVVWKPGFEPVEEQTPHEKLVALLVDKGVIQASDATAIGVDAAAVEVKP